MKPLVLVMVGCGGTENAGNAVDLSVGPDDQLVTESVGGKQAPSKPKAEVATSTPAEDADPVAELQKRRAKQAEWGRVGEGISIAGNSKVLFRESTTELAWCGSMSRNPVQANTGVTVKVTAGNNGSIFSYVGFTSADVNVNSWAHGKRPSQYCLYFSGGPKYAGIHDSKKNPDWQNNVVPPISDGEVVTITYSPASGTIEFSRDGVVVYEGKGFEGDLYVFGAVKFPQEKLTIVDPEPRN